MQQSLIYLLIFCVLMAIQGFYFGFIRPPRVMAWLQQSAFIVMTFILIPFLIFTLQSQDDATGRLAETGFKPHPAIIESLGIATGAGKNSTWVFEINADREQVQNFYRDTENTGNWVLSTDTHVMMIFKKANQRMTIGYRKGRDSNTISFMLSEKE